MVTAEPPSPSSGPPRPGWKELRAELAAALPTGRFWSIVLRSSVPVVGVFLLGWPAFQAALFFLLESWLFLSFRCAVEITIDPRYAGAAGVPTGTLAILRGVLISVPFSAVAMGVLVGMFGWPVVTTVFSPADWQELLDVRWRAPSFLGGLAALVVTNAFEAVGHARRFSTRTAAEAERDDLRTAAMFYRIVGLMATTIGLGVVQSFGSGPQLIVVGMALVTVYVEGLSHHAAHALGMPVKATPAKG